MKRTVVVSTIPYPLKWDRSNLSVRIEDKVVDVHFERQYRLDTDPRVSWGVSTLRIIQVKNTCLAAMKATRLIKGA